ncbi:MAG: hypothetical protein WDM96_11285 [Lacunisphaera sp.]
MPPEQKSPVTIEDLLHLKKAERPGQEFWSQFERELRQKQLTALVQKRHWWHDLPVLLSRRVYMPAGAAAIVAFTLVTVRYSVSSPVAQIENTASKITAIDPAVEMLPVTEVSLTGRSSARQEELVTPVRVSRHEATPALVASAQGDLTEVVGLLPVQAQPETETPSARSIAANLAHLEQAEPELVNAVMGSRLTPARVATNADLSLDGETDGAKKYQLIARYAEHSLSPEPAAPVLVRERIARRLGDDITERISRVGLEGSRVSLKF